VFRGKLIRRAKARKAKVSQGKFQVIGVNRGPATTINTANTTTTTTTVNNAMTASNFVSFSNQNVNGSVIVRPAGNNLNLQYALQNVDPNCVTPAAAPHSCGIQLLLGNCSTATNNNAPLSNDPWNNAVYKSDNLGNANGIVNLNPPAGSNFSAGAVVMIYDSNGAPLACAPIPIGTRGYY